MALAQHLWTRCCDQRFFFSFGEISPKCEKKFKLLEYYVADSLKFLKKKKKKKKTIKVEVLSWFCQI
jgi:hypothetical protein